jgi:hypothetical protein
LSAAALSAASLSFSSYVFSTGAVVVAAGAAFEASQAA